MTTLEYIRSNHFRITSIASISMDRPTFLKKGEPARLFPVLADSSKEGRASRKDVEPSAIAQEMAADIAEGQSAGE